MTLQIIADEKIPLLPELFGKSARLTFLPGREIQNTDLQQADILLVRSVTPVNAALLKNTPVKFVGTATTGTDHIDQPWLQKNNIGFASAKGCNAVAVAEYVTCCIAALRKQNYLLEKKLTAGVIGVGFVGSEVVKKLQALDFTVLSNDPPRALAEKNFHSTPLTELANVDLLCVHTPLTHGGEFPTHHLLNAAFFQRLKPGCIILNAGRGAVLDSRAALHYPQLKWCIDVWEHEPHIELDFLKHATVATPHIGGYSEQAKWRASVMLYTAAQKIFTHLPKLTEAFAFPQRTFSINSNARSWEEVLLQIYNPLTDTLQLQQLAAHAPENVPFHFDQLRRAHRPEFAYLHLANTAHLSASDNLYLQKLGFKIA